MVNMFPIYMKHLYSTENNENTPYSQSRIIGGLLARVDTVPWVSPLNPGSMCFNTFDSLVDSD